MNKTELFLEKYKRLEEAAVNYYGFRNDGKAILYLQNRTEFRHIRSELDYCRDVRNLLSHRPKIDNDYAVYPTDKMMELLDRVLYKVENPIRAKDIAIPLKDIFFCGIDDCLLPIMTVMSEKSYTYVPVMKNGRVVGVLSENVLMSYLVREKSARIDEKIRLSELYDYLLLENHGAESFRFAPQEQPAACIEELFEQARKNHDRIGLVFLTQNGRADEKITGMITTWDIAAF